MNNAIELICWTLLHSLWQGLVIAFLLSLTLRSIPSKFSGLRYNLSMVAFSMVILSGLLTFLFLLFQPASPANSSLLTTAAPPVTPHASNPQWIQFEGAGGWRKMKLLVSQYRYLIFYGWMTGALLCTARYLVGFIYINTLKNQTIPLSSGWQVTLEKVVAQLGITRLVQLAESSRISVPMVVGYLKPMVLVPVGMLAGLAPAQVESILWHELSHVKRNDFLVNLFQSAVEVVLFFNPFVWFISAHIRKEREHCCDDMVVSHIQNPMIYARTLAQLEEFRVHQGMTLAPALLGNRNELLNRINRIMEKSMKNQMGKEKWLPMVVLLFAGLVCASWVGFKPVTHNSIMGDPMDTVIKDKNEKSATYSRKSVTVFDENGKPHEEVTEDFEGDESLRALMSIPAFPAVPAIPAFPSIPNMDAAIFEVPLAPMAADTFPDLHFFQNEKDWEAFGEEFEKEFKSKFGDFYDDHAAEFEKMMKDMERKFNSKDWEAQLGPLRMHEGEWEKSLLALKNLDESLMSEQMEKTQEALRRMEEDLRKMDLTQLQKMEELELLQEGKIRDMERDIKKMEENMHRFESELSDELHKDGYLGKDEKIETIDWEDDGDIKINGKAIKEADKSRYKSLHRKFFKSGGRFHYVE